MGEDIFLTSAPFLFVLMSLYILFELIRINAFIGGAWELDSLMCIPIIFCLVYLYIGIYNPPIELARNVLRIGVSASLGIGCYIVYAYSRMLRRRGKK